MRVASKILKEAIDVCHGSKVYIILTREEKRSAVLYCLRIVGNLYGQKVRVDA